MPTKLSSYYRERIIALWKEGANVSAIVRLLHGEGRTTTRATVRRWIFRWEEDIMCMYVYFCMTLWLPCIMCVV